MYVKFNGVISGDNSSGDYISEIKIVWKAGVESEASAITAGRVVTLTAGTDDAKIAAFRLSGGGVQLDCGTLTSGTTYTPAVMITETRTGGGTSASGWTNGSPFTPTAANNYALVGSPSNFTATDGSGQVVLNWTATATGTPTGYKIYKAAVNANGTPGTWDAGTSVSGGSTATHTYTGLTNNTAYWFRIVAVNASGEGLPAADCIGWPRATPQYEETFESYSLGANTATAQWAATHTISTNVNGTGKALSGTSASWTSTYDSFTKVVPTRIRAKIQLTGNFDGTKIIGFTEYGIGWTLQITAAADGHWKHYYGGSFQNLTVDTLWTLGGWYMVEALPNYTNHTYQLYINGTSAGTMSMQESGGTGVTRIEVQAHDKVKIDSIALI